MTITLSEGNLQIAFPSGSHPRKFDSASHGLAHCMKAVDFIVELEDRYLFIEFKDPDHPNSQPKQKEKFVKDFLNGNIDEDLKHKYRDSFLYEWASGQANKSIYYYVLVAIDTLDEAVLLTRTESLKQKLPREGPPSNVWKQNIVAGCAVFNLSTWNKHFKTFPVSRATSKANGS